MSKSDHWMPLYVGDYLRDTGHLSAEEHGAYLLLLMHAWTRGGTLPADDEQLRRVTRMAKKAWQASRETVLAFFERTEEGYRNGRVVRERGKAAQISAARQAAGAVGARAKWNSPADRESAARKTRSERLAAARERGRHTAEEWSSLVAFCGGKCVRCGAQDRLAKDHIIPIYQGGSDAIDNLQPLCFSCNSSKGPDRSDHRPAGWERLAKRLANACQMPRQPQPQLKKEDTPPSPSESGPPTARRGSRLAPDWTPGADERAFAESLGLDPEQVAAKFRDYWHAAPGAKGIKANWPATWRNWCRSDAERRPHKPAERAGKLDWLWRDMEREAATEAESLFPETRRLIQ